MSDARITPKRTQSLARRGKAADFMDFPKQRDLVRAVRFSLYAMAAGGALFTTPSPAHAAGHHTLPIPMSAADPTRPFVGAGRAYIDPASPANTLRVVQESSKTMLNWQSFNIGRDAAVEFKQPDAAAVAINRIWQGSPSEIYGALRANGQVYLINQNGILFGAGVQVNVATLVASSLDITTEAIDDGIGRAIDKGRPAFEAFAQGATGDVTIAPGATLTAQGGQIMVFAPNVEQHGTIHAPDGQAILAAGTKIYLMQSEDTNLRGFAVEVDVSGVSNEQLQRFVRGEIDPATDRPAALPMGRVTNAGVIEAARGNITLAGLAVNQTGRLSVTTAVRANGSIRLQARDSQVAPDIIHQTYDGTAIDNEQRAKPTRAGVVRLGPDSVTEARLDLDDPEATVDANVQQRSEIRVTGHSIHLEDRSRIVAPAGDVKLYAQEDLSKNPGDVSAPQNRSRVYIGRDSVIDVRGADIELSMARNFLEVELRGDQLKNNPFQRDGFLQNKKITVDLRKKGVRADGSTWQGTPLADIAGDVAAIRRTIGERSLAGGTVEIKSQGDVVIRDGARIDVSGGRIRYQDGFDLGTKLVAIDGRVYDIADAPLAGVYTAFAHTFSQQSRKWGQMQTWFAAGAGATGGRLPGYVEGKDAGQVTVVAARNAIEGDPFRGAVTPGPFQRLPQDFPLPGLLLIGDNSKVNTDTPDLRVPAIRFGQPRALPDAFSATDPLPDDYPSETVLSPGIFGPERMGRGEFYSNGPIVVPRDVTLDLPHRGSIEFTAGRIEIEGRLNLISGDATLTARPTVAIPLGNDIVFGDAGAIESRGTWVNDNPLLNLPGTPLASLFIDGGKVALDAQGDVTLPAGSVIDVSGGAWLRADGRLVAGRGGHIAIETNSVASQVTPANLVLDAELRGYALSEGGRLTISARRVCIAAAGCGDPAAPGAPPLLITPVFFRQGGFAEYNIGSNLEGLTVAEGTRIEPRMLNLKLSPGFGLRPSGSDLRGFSDTVLLPDHLRVPADLALSVNAGLLGVNIDSSNFAQLGILHLAAGARIDADPGAKVTLRSNSRLLVEGDIYAPAGRIALELGNGLNTSRFLSAQTLWLGAGARLSAAGVARLLPDPLGRRRGDVLPGGTIVLDAKRGYIVAEKGSVIDVSGTAATLDIANGPTTFETRTVPSAAGRIALLATEGMLLGGELRGHAGGPGAPGGELSLLLDATDKRRNDDLTIPWGGPIGSRVIQVGGADPFGGAAGLAPGADVPLTLNGLARLTPETIRSGGFDSLALVAPHLKQNGNPRAPGRILFQGDVDLQLGRRLVLDAPVIASDGGVARLAAPYVAIGPTDRDSQIPVGTQSAPQDGNGVLAVRGQLVDLIGSTVLQGFNRTQIDPALGTRIAPVHLAADDIRLRGVQGMSGDARLELRGAFTGYGDILLEAGQIYPTTLSRFTIEASGAPGARITIARPANAAAGPVLSAGGRVTLKADEIVQRGTLKAPIGEIELAAGTRAVLDDGSLTSTSAEGQLIPFGRVQAGTDWVYGLENGVVLAFDGTQTFPEKRVRVSAPSVEVHSGAGVDLSGGGDLYAYEFISGPTGSRDVLSARAGVYAVLPGADFRFAPIDPQEYAGSDLRPGDSVYLAGGNGLPAGTYALLPARYALLPGAYLVTEMSGFQDIGLGQRLPLADGSSVIAGQRRFADTGIGVTRTAGFAVRPGTSIAREARYDIAFANAFFTEQAAERGTAAARLPRDGGVLAIAAQRELILEAGLRAAAAAGGRGAAVDIAAERMAIVSSRGQAGVPDGFLSLRAGDLTALGAESLLLGGTRRDTAEGVEIDVSASQIVVSNDAANPLAAPEVLIAAKDRVAVSSGSVVQDRGATTGPAPTLVIGRDADANANDPGVSGDGALLRVAGGAQAELRRRNVSRQTGVLDVAPGARLEADALLIDATRDLITAPGTIMPRRALAVGASRISLGNAPAGTPGVVFSAADIQALQGLEHFGLRSYTSVDFHAAAANGLDLNFENLSIDAAEIGGYLAAGQVVNLNASGDVSFAGPADGVSGSLTGAGALNVNAGGRITLGDGSYAIRGFDQINLAAGQGIVGRGRGELTAAGDLSLSAPRLTGARRAHTQISAVDDGDPNAPRYRTLSLSRPATSGTAVATELGARLDLTGGTVRHDGRIDLPSGIVTVTAKTGDLTAGAASETAVAGSALRFDDKIVYAPAGSVTFTAERGNVALAPGTVVDVSSARDAAGRPAGGDAGTITINAPRGTVDVAGADLRGHAASDAVAGAFRVDAGALAAAAANDALSSLIARLTAGGFHETVDLRLRTGDVTIAATDTLRAHEVRVAADVGAITLAARTAGTAIDASGERGGRVLLTARDDVRLESGAVIDAGAAGDGEDGGTVGLYSGTGGIRLAAGSRIDVGGGANGKDGEVRVRLPREAVQTLADADPTNDRLVLAGTIDGAAHTTVEAFKVYTDADGAITAAETSDASTNQLYEEARTFMATAPALPGGAQLLPGIEVRAIGDLILGAAWDLSRWRFSGTPGVLTLRAAGDLSLNQSLSDGFSGTAPTSPLLPRRPDGTADASWSYRLVAGADSTAADPLSVLDPPGLANGKGNVAVGANTLVRTGTGDIEIAAGRDVRLADKSSVIYTAGASSATGILLTKAATLGGRPYPEGGGDILVHAAENVVGAITDQLVNNWLFRAGRTTGIPTQTSATGWTVVYEHFRQNIGALGGGDIRVRAGGDVRNLSAVIPTIGRQIGGETPSASVVDVIGGGDLSVDAGGDITSGVYYIGRGQGRLRAGGSIRDGRTVSANNQNPLYTALALGEGEYSLTARENIFLQTVFNPTVVPQSANQVQLNQGGHFFTYAPDSAVRLMSVGGDVVLANSVDNLRAAVQGLRSSGDDFWRSLSVYSSRLKAAALAGDLEINDSFTLFPSPQGDLQLLAGGSVVFNNSRLRGVRVTLSDVDPALLPDLARPAAGQWSSGVNDAHDLLIVVSQETRDFHAPIPVHDPERRRLAGLPPDEEPVRIVALGGDIRMNQEAGKVTRLEFAKPARLWAARDVQDVSVFAQNLRDTDITSVTAGRDIVYISKRAGTNESSPGQFVNNLGTINLSGPGALVVQAGRHVDLATSIGIVTDGNTTNPALADVGADVAVLAGVGGAPDGTGFVDRYFDPQRVLDRLGVSRPGFLDEMRRAAGDSTLSDFGAALARYSELSADDRAAVDSRLGLPAEQAAELTAAASYQHQMLLRMRDTSRNPDLDAAGALAAFRQASPLDRQPVVLAAFFNELRESGRAAVRSGSGDYSRGERAIGALYPGDVSSAGDLSLFFSKINTLDGGGIDLLAPHGRINAGLSTAPASLGVTKATEELGIVARSVGDVRAYSYGDFLVNESRVFAADSGSILMWSAFGDIDAGRGAKTAISAPPPRIFFVNGRPTLLFPPALQGSGIRTFVTTPGRPAGDVDLFAPNGTINAGDAGIGSAGNVTLGAQQVIGADNIDVGGIGFGVPVVDAGGLGAAFSGVSGLSSSVAKSAEETAAATNPNAGDEDLSSVDVEVLGFGESGEPIIGKPAAGDRRKRRGADE